MLQHAREHIVGQQTHILREHAEDQPVDEMRDRLGIMAARPQRLGQRGEGGRRALGEGLAALAGTQPLRIGHRPLELVPRGRVRQIVQRELVRHAHAVGPVGIDAEARHVGDDQERRVFQRQRVLAQLVEGRVQVLVLALVLPGEAVPFPHIGPAGAARVFARAALETVAFAGRVVLRRRRLVQESAQVDEMLLRGRAFLQHRRPPLGDELSRRHAVTNPASAPWLSFRYNLRHAIFRTCSC